MSKQRKDTIGTKFGTRTFAHAGSMYTEMVLFFCEHQSSPLKKFCREEGLEYKCYHSLRRVILTNPILACLMRNQPDSGFTKRMSLDALKAIPPSFQTEESLHHDIKQLYHRFKQNEKSPLMKVN